MQSTATVPWQFAYSCNFFVWCLSVLFSILSRLQVSNLSGLLTLTSNWKTIIISSFRLENGTSFTDIYVTRRKCPVKSGRRVPLVITEFPFLLQYATTICCISTERSWMKRIEFKVCYCIFERINVTIEMNLYINSIYT